MGITLQQKLSIERMIQLRVPKMQIAKELGISRQTVYQHLERVRKPVHEVYPDPSLVTFAPAPNGEATEVTRDQTRRVLAEMILDDSGRVNPTDRQRAIQRYWEMEGWSLGEETVALPETSDEDERLERMLDLVSADPGLSDKLAASLPALQRQHVQREDVVEATHPTP